MAVADETNDTVFHPSDEFRQNAHIRSMDEYARKYKESIDDPEGFWSQMAEDFFFKVQPSTEKGEFLQYNMDITKGPIEIKWMKGATTNICYNVVDRIIERGNGHRVAYICVGSEPGHERKITYNELKAQVCKLANVYKSKGIKKGDRIACYMPMTVELVISMLAAARIGAIHSVVFAGFSSDALAERIVDAKCKLLVTADGVFRGAKFIPLKEIVDSAVDKCERLNHHITNVIVYHHLKCPAQLVNSYRSNGCFNGISGPLVSPVIKGGLNGTSTTNGNGLPSNGNTNGHSAGKGHGTSNGFTNGTSNGFTNGNGCTNGFTNGVNGVVKKNSPVPSITWNPQVDLWWHEVMDKSSPDCEPVWVDAEDALFILYTSGSTGKPKGVVHTTGGYMIYAATTFKYVFHYLGGDIFFCTADLGWITGHTVNVYGALANGATILLFDGTPFYPDPGRLWQIIDRYSVATFYTAPTAIRALMKYGDSYVKKYSRASLRLLGTAGEPINPEAWYWYYRVVGNSQCPIVDTFWQTETAAPMLTSLPGCTPMKPGSATFPFFGVVPAVLNDDGKELTGDCSGHLVFKSPWPAILRTVDGNHARYEITYFNKFPGYYYSGDGVRRDKDGYYWVTGRTDDLLNVSGHLLSTAEVESALLEHEAVAETAAVSSVHPIKGESIYCFVVLKDGHEFSKDLDFNMKQKVRSKIGAIAAPEVIHFASALPKTRSGKIVRRILRKIARESMSSREELDEDLTTVADVDIIDELIRSRDMYVIT